MPEFTSHAPGTFCWAELVTTDADAAKTFYCDLMGWTFHDDIVGPDAVYTTLSRGGKHVAALYRRNAKQAEAGVPPHWGAYVSVADADAAAARVREAGGGILMEPFDVATVGRMAICRDPQGAVFSVWQPGHGFGAHLKDEPGSLCWTELLTGDTARAGAFYRRVFGWEPRPDTIGGLDYTVFLLDGAPAAGMMELQKMWGEMPPHWLLYFAVAECDGTVARAVAAGGRSLCPAQDIEPGRFAILADPQGAAFGILEPRRSD